MKLEQRKFRCWSSKTQAWEVSECLELEVDEAIYSDGNDERSGPVSIYFGDIADARSFLRDLSGIVEAKAKELGEKATEPKIIESGKEDEAPGSSRLEHPSAFAIIEWPDETETCAWRSDNIRRRGTEEKNVRRARVE